MLGHGQRPAKASIARVGEGGNGPLPFHPPPQVSWWEGRRGGGLMHVK